MNHMEMSYIGGDLDVMGNSLDGTEERGACFIFMKWNLTQAKL